MKRGWTKSFYRWTNKKNPQTFTCYSDAADYIYGNNYYANCFRGGACVLLPQSATFRFRGEP